MLRLFGMKRLEFLEDFSLEIFNTSNFYLRFLKYEFDGIFFPKQVLFYLHKFLIFEYTYIEKRRKELWSAERIKVG